jgi:hypothetical protein
LREARTRGCLPIRACGMGKSKDRVHTRYYHRDRGSLTSRLVRMPPATRL